MNYFFRIRKYNKNHDDDGRFASAPGSGALDAGAIDKVVATLTQVADDLDTKILRRSLRNPRTYHNPFANSLVREALGRMKEDLQKGVGLRQALDDSFEQGQYLHTAFLKALTKQKVL